MVCGGVSSRSAPGFQSSACRLPRRRTTSMSTGSPAGARFVIRLSSQRSNASMPVSRPQFHNFQHTRIMLVSNESGLCGVCAPGHRWILRTRQVLGSIPARRRLSRQAGTQTRTTGRSSGTGTERDGQRPPLRSCSPEPQVPRLQLPRMSSGGDGFEEISPRVYYPNSYPSAANATALEAVET